MARGKSADDLTTLQMALVGYQIEKQKIDDKIREIQGVLKGRRPAAGGGEAAEKPAAATRRVLSPAARKRIAAAQKKRWAEHRKRLAQGSKASD